MFGEGHSKHRWSFSGDQIYYFLRTKLYKIQMRNSILHTKLPNQLGFAIKIGYYLLKGLLFINIKDCSIFYST